MAIVFLPQGSASMASSKLSLNGYTSYPAPVSKPFQCSSNDNTESKHEVDIDQKQAAAMALGIYLGIKQATAPQNKIEITELCV